MNGTPVVPRVSRSEAAFDIRSQRKLAVDEPFTVAETSRPLLAASWRVQAPAPAARCRGAPTRVGSRCRAAGAATARLSDTGQPASGRGWQPNLGLSPTQRGARSARGRVSYPFSFSVCSRPAPNPLYAGNKWPASGPHWAILGPMGQALGQLWDRAKWLHAFEKPGKHAYGMFATS